jgi:hypothetical protein
VRFSEAQEAVVKIFFSHREKYEKLLIKHSGRLSRHSGCIGQAGDAHSASGMVPSSPSATSSMARMTKPVFGSFEEVKKMDDKHVGNREKSVK